MMTDYICAILTTSNEWRFASNQISLAGAVVWPSVSLIARDNVSLCTFSLLAKKKKHNKTRAYTQTRPVTRECGCAKYVVCERVNGKYPVTDTFMSRIQAVCIPTSFLAFSRFLSRLTFALKIPFLRRKKRFNEVFLSHLNLSETYFFYIKTESNFNIYMCASMRNSNLYLKAFYFCLNAQFE